MIFHMNFARQINLDVGVDDLFLSITRSNDDGDHDPDHHHHHQQQHLTLVSMSVC